VIGYSVCALFLLLFWSVIYLAGGTVSFELRWVLVGSAAFACYLATLGVRVELAERKRHTLVEFVDPLLGRCHTSPSTESWTTTVRLLDDQTVLLRGRSERPTEVRLESDGTVELFFEFEDPNDLLERWPMVGFVNGKIVDSGWAP